MHVLPSAADRQRQIDGEPEQARHDFVQAQAIWEDERRRERPVAFDIEPRLQVVGEIRGIVWSAIVTYRGPRIRIISRRARHEEAAAYRNA